jgi:hypothetical protein
MNETLESLLEMFCKTTVKGQQNEKQTLYLLTDAKDARLAYDLLMGTGLEARYIAEDNLAKLYVQNASVAACENKIAQALATAPFFKEIKDTLDRQEGLVGDYSLSLTSTATGRQLTVLLPAAEKTHKSPAANTSQSTNKSSAIAAAPKHRPAAKPALSTDEDTMLAGPAVARTAIPKQFKTSATEEDPLSKRILFYLSGKAFTSGAWAMFVLLILGLVFSVLVTIRGFLCPDVATDQSKVPSYCPQKSTPKEE